MGFFDAFDNPDFMASLLGVPPTSVPQPQSAPQQPAPQPAPAAVAQDPNMLGGANFMPGPQANASRSAGLPVGQPPAIAAAQLAPDAAPAGAPGIVDPAGAGASAPPQVTMPMPTPAPAGVDDPNMVMNPQGGAPSTDQSARRAVPVPSAANAGAAPAPAPAQSNGLSSQLTGLKPVAPDKWGQFAAGVGKGLSAVGQMRPGATVGQAFAAGAGGGLQGAYEAGQKEDQEFFRNTIAADNQTMKGKMFPLDVEHKQASTSLLNATAQKNLQNAALGPMGKVYGSWLNSDVGRMKLADTAFDNEQKRIVQRLKDKGASGVDVTNDWKKMEDTEEKRRTDTYKRYGISDPLNYKGSEKNPIDASTMTPAQIEQAPEGTYFKYTDKNGKSLVAPRDYTVRPNRAAVQGQQSNSDYAATQAALAGGGTQY